MTKKGEWDFIIDYIRENVECIPKMRKKGITCLCYNQLISLWTAYCLHNDVFPDTYEWDNDMLSLYHVIATKFDVEISEKDLNEFDILMSTYLV